MIGGRLKIARAATGLSLRDLESKIGNIVSAQALGKYERDEMMPGSKVLMALAEALGVSESYLVDQAKISLDGVEFRKNRITNKREEAQIEAAVLNFLEKYLEVETVLQVSSLEWEKPRQSSFYVTNIVEGELSAKNLREQWNLGIEPIGGLAEFLEERGTKVLSLELPPSISGMTCMVRRPDDGLVPVIVINKLDTGERQRFTLCHELGHMVLSVSQDVDEEKAAHRFAGAFLMPAEVMRAEIGMHRRFLSIGELLALKKIFGVSVQAITYRCKDLGIINQETYRSLFEMFAKRGWRKPPYKEPEPISQEEPQRFKRLCFRALTENAITEAKAAELLGISVGQLNQDMQLC